MHYPIYIITDKNHEAALELTGFADELASLTGSPVKAIMPCGAPPRETVLFIEKAGIDLYVLQSPDLENLPPEGIINAILKYMPKPEFSFMIFLNDAKNSGPAAALGAHYGISCITGVESLGNSDESLTFIRTVRQGKLNEVIYDNDEPAIVTMMPGSFSFSGETPGIPGETKYIDSDAGLNNTLTGYFSEGEAEDSPLTGAEIIVSAGGGAEKAFALGLIESFAGVFPRSAIGGSRVACDRGFIEYNAQIGLTGRKVSPKLYIACGISGSLQHLAGIKGAHYIAAVNRDPDAPIFRAADIGFVDELENFIPAFLKLLDKNK